MLQTIYLPDISIGDGVTLAYPFTYRILATTDILIIRESTVSSIQTTLELDSDYTIASQWVNTDDGGEIVFAVAPSTTSRIYRYRHTARTQLVQLITGGNFNAAAIEKVFDRLTMLVQEIDEAANRSLGVLQRSIAVPADAESVAIVFDEPMDNANYNVLFMTASWQTTTSASAKTTAGFTINFGVQAGSAGGTVVYGVSP